MRLCRWTVLLAAVAAGLAGCEPAPIPPDPSRNVNGGVQIIPEAVLAAQRVTPDTTQPAPEDKPNLVTVIATSQEDHQLILRAIRDAGYVPMLQSKGPFTLIAPTDDAFSKMPPGLFARLCTPQHLPQLRHLLDYHLMRGAITPDDLLQTNGSITTLSGQRLVIKGIDGKIMVNDANVVKTNTTASNGVICWVDNVLLPP